MKSPASFRLLILMFSILVFSGIATLMSGCKKDSIPVTSYPVIDPNLLGVWRSDTMAKVLVFKENHEFLDSVFCGGISPLSLLYVFQGHFTIKDGFIQLDDVNLIYYYAYSDTTTGRFQYEYPNIKIFLLNKNQLGLTPTMILTPKSSNDSGSLSGIWSTDMLVTAFDWEQKPPLVNGNDLRVYMFLPDSLMYNVNHILQYGNKTEEYNSGAMPYVFTMPNHLMLGSEEFKISFKNKQMYLDSKDEYYVKIN